MRNALPMILVALLVLAGLAGLMFLGGGSRQDARLDASVIGFDGLGPVLGAEGLGVIRSNPRLTVSESMLSFRILPLYDVDLYASAPEPATPREAFYATTLREASEWDMGWRVANIPSMAILPKWVAGTVTTAVAHDSTLIPLNQVQALPEQLAKHPLRLIRPVEGFFIEEVGTHQLALFQPQLFDRDTLPYECFEVLTTSKGALLIGCSLPNYDTQFPLYLLSDPDLMNNHGLALADNAALAAFTVKALAPEASGDEPKRIYIDTEAEDRVNYYDYEDQRQDYDRTGEDFARFFEPPLTALWAVLTILLGLALWRGARRFGPARPDPDHTPEQSKLAAIATNARLLRIAGHDSRMASDLVQANLSDLAQSTFGRAAGSGPQGIARLYAHLFRRDPTKTAELQAVAARLTDINSPPSPTELHRQLDAFRRLLETLTHGK